MAISLLCNMVSIDSGFYHLTKTINHRRNARKMQSFIDMRELNCLNGEQF